jgi:hypothetical protein
MWDLETIVAINQLPLAPRPVSLAWRRPINSCRHSGSAPSIDKSGNLYCRDCGEDLDQLPILKGV